VRLVAGPAGGVVPDPARREVGAEGAGEVTGADVVGRHDQSLTTGQRLLGIEQRGEQIRTDGAGSAQVDRLAGPDPGREVSESLVSERYVQQRS
jgi:hypothetical protein